MSEEDKREIEKAVKDAAKQAEAERDRLLKNLKEAAEKKGKK